MFVLSSLDLNSLHKSRIPRISTKCEQTERNAPD